MARIKLGVPDVKEIREGETEHRYIKGKGLVGYTKYENQIYSSNLYPSAVPPIIDKKQNNIINNTVTTVSVSDVDLSDSSSAPSAVIANGDHILFLDATSGNGLRKESLSDLSSLLAGNGISSSSSVLNVGAGTLIDVGTNDISVDLSEASAAVMAAADEIIFLDADDSNAAKKETLQDLLDTIAGTVATTGIDRSGATLVVSDLHPVGVSGSDNQLLTDDGDGTVTSESNLTFDGSGLTVTGTVTVGSDGSGSDVIFYSATNGDNLTWDASAKQLIITGANSTTALDITDGNLAVADSVDIEGNIDVNGTSNLDNTDIDGTFAVDGTTISLDATTSLNIDNSNTSNGVTIGTATSGMPISIGHTVSETTVNDNLSVTGILDITNTTQATNTTGDTGALRCEGGASIAKNVHIGGNAHIGASGGSSGSDFTAYGDTNGTYMKWDESSESLEIIGTNGNDALFVDVGDVHIDEVLNLDGSVDADVTDFDVASSGDIDLVSTNNAVGAITIHANGGTSETILIRSDQGTAATEGAASVQLLSDVGGINIKSGLNNANAILLTADGGTSETIVLHSDQGTGAASIALVSDVGGVTVDAGLDIELNADGGNVIFKDGSQQALNIDMDDTAGDAVFKDAGDTEIFRIDGSENSVRFTGYGLTNSDPYAVSIKPLNSTQHMTMGLADKQNNYSMIGIYSLAAAAISGVSADSNFDDW